jgi:hypothetical protein
MITDRVTLDKAKSLERAIRILSLMREAKRRYREAMRGVLSATDVLSLYQLRNESEAMQRVYSWLMARYNNNVLNAIELPELS